VSGPVGTGPERVVLEAMLDENRESLIGCVDGLSEEDARRTLVPSLTTPLGVLKHVACAERSWFQRRLAALPQSEWDGYAYGDEPSWSLAETDTVESVIEEFQRAASRSRQIAAAYDLEHTIEHDVMGTLSLRWIYLHMIEEVTRHAGHADILREQIDGRTAT
jgi:uncharacterized damage-inducible protein DinB